MRDAQLIKSLGGPANVARLLNLDGAGSTQRVFNWMRRGIPAQVKLDHPHLFLQHPPHVLPLRSYRATLVPAGVEADQIELRASQGVLPTVQLKAVNTGIAEQLAHWVTGRPVFSVVRVEPVVQASGLVPA